MTRRSEIDWLYRGVARFFPEEWERFRAGAGPGSGPDAERAAGTGGTGGVDSGLALASRYARRLDHPDPGVRATAADDWCAWEDTVLSLEPGGRRDLYRARPPAARLALVRICSRYVAHAAWLEEGVLLREAGRLAGIPGVLVHGRQDLSGPFATAWELAHAWPDADLVPITDAGHQGGAATSARLRRALAEFAAR